MKESQTELEFEFILSKLLDQPLLLLDLVPPQEHLQEEIGAFSIIKATSCKATMAREPSM